MTDEQIVDTETREAIERVLHVRASGSVNAVYGDDADCYGTDKDIAIDWMAAELTRLRTAMAFLKSKGLTVGMAKEAGKEPYLAYDIEPGSELCDRETLSKLLDAEIERDRLRATFNGFLEMNPESIDGWHTYDLLEVIQADARTALAAAVKGMGKDG